MRIGWWPHTRDPRVASYRLRCLQIVQALRTRGYDVSIFTPGKGIPPDILVLSKRYDPDTLKQALALRASNGTHLILDVCDNHFHADWDSDRWNDRPRDLATAIDAMDRVVAASEALAGVIREHTGLTEVSVIGDAVEPPRIPTGLVRLAHPKAEWDLARLRERLGNRKVTPGRRLVWFGNQASRYAKGGLSDMAKIRTLLESLHREEPLTLTVISNNRRQYRQLVATWQLPTQYLQWHPDTFSRAMALHDISVIPISPNPFTRCKTANRVQTALVHGLAVMADSIPSYREMAAHIVLDDWEHGLEKLMNDHAWRKQLVESGRKSLAQSHSLEHITDQWEKALKFGEAENDVEFL